MKKGGRLVFYNFIWVLISVINFMQNREKILHIQVVDLLSFNYNDMLYRRQVVEGVTECTLD